MLFNSFEFIFVFLPVVFLLFFLFNKFKLHLATKIWLFITSLFFYGFWNPSYLPIILFSILFNRFISIIIVKASTPEKSKAYLTFGVVCNILLLGYYKYYDFFVTNINTVFKTDYTLLHLLLPLGISFFTFQQIGYLVDTYRGETKQYSFLDYALFVTFFPQLIAGPIVHHQELMPQFHSLKKRFFNFHNIALGFFIFSVGLFKKVMIADSLAKWANKGFLNFDSLTTIDSWITSLSYTFQLYFDFSGYSDMAIGIALLFNITLPINFNSPYKARNIQDFWRRWHITLSRFLTQYIYIPLGGSRKGNARTYVNIMIIFLVSGFWHGAGWTFIIWGALHGIASVICRFWGKLPVTLPKLLSWFITFQFINATWVFFRAPDVATAMSILKTMFNIPAWFHQPVQAFKEKMVLFGNIDIAWDTIWLVVGCFLLVVVTKNSHQLKDKFKPHFLTVLFVCALLLYSLVNITNISEFLYFNF